MCAESLKHGLVIKLFGSPVYDVTVTGWQVTTSSGAGLWPVGTPPVSYTHLDVYKRQDVHYALLSQKDISVFVSDIFSVY